MKRHLTLVLVPIIALALAAGTATAQSAPQAGPPAGAGPGSGRQGGAQRRMQMLMQGITLTTEQQARVDSISAAFQARMPAFTPGEMPDSASRAQRMQLGQQRDAAIKAVLTPEQQRVFDTNVQNMQANMPQRPGN